jgi:hypothetical protein
MATEAIAGPVGGIGPSCIFSFLMIINNFGIVFSDTK